MCSVKRRIDMDMTHVSLPVQLCIRHLVAAQYHHQHRFRLRCSINISDALPTATALTTTSDIAIVIVSKLIRQCLRLKLSNKYPVNFLQFTFIHIVSEIWSVCIYESKWLHSYSKIFNEFWFKCTDIVLNEPNHSTHFQSNIELFMMFPFDTKWTLFLFLRFVSNYYGITCNGFFSINSVNLNRGLRKLRKYTQRYVQTLISLGFLLKMVFAGSGAFGVYYTS